ncbi:Coatomer subunit zeta-3 [Linum perenne]
MQQACPQVKNILLLDSEGNRVAVKYYGNTDWPTDGAKEAFEKLVFSKTRKTNVTTEADVIMLDGYVIVYKFAGDLCIFVTGGEDQNEVTLAAVLHCFFEAICMLLRGDGKKKNALENLDQILLCLDEAVDDGGIPLETDGIDLADKVEDYGDKLEEHDTDSEPLSETKLATLLSMAREHYTESINK